LPDVDPPGTEAFQTPHFSPLVTGAKIEMEPVVARLGVVARHQAESDRRAVFRSEQVTTIGARPYVLVVEGLAPKRAHPLDI
jgi:hypothetical protein